MERRGQEAKGRRLVSTASGNGERVKGPELPTHLNETRPFDNVVDRGSKTGEDEEDGEGVWYTNQSKEIGKWVWVCVLVLKERRFTLWQITSDPLSARNSTHLKKTRGLYSTPPDAHHIMKEW